MIYRRNLSVAAVLATIFAGSVEAGLLLRESKAVAAETTDDMHQEPEVADWDKGLEMTIEKGGKCKAGGKEGKGFGRECEGCFKQVASFETSAEDLTKNLASGVSDMLTEMMPKEEGLRLTNDAMDEVASWDSNNGDIIDVFEDGDCSEDLGCKKTVKIGGYVKMFWDCNITFSKTDDGKMSKEVDCGGKSYEGMGRNHTMGYHHGAIDKKKFHKKYHADVHG